MLAEHLSNRTGDRHPVVGVDVDLANTMLDAPLNLLNRHAPGLRHLATELVDDVLQFLWHARGAVHHKVAVGQPLVDLLNPSHGEHFAVRLAGELVGTVTGSDRHRECVDTRGFDEAGRFIRIRQQLVVRQGAGGTVAVFRFAGAALERTEAAQLTLNRHALSVGAVDHLLGDASVVFKVSRRLAIFLQ